MHWASIVSFCPGSEVCLLFTPRAETVWVVAGGKDSSRSRPSPMAAMAQAECYSTVWTVRTPSMPSFVVGHLSYFHFV